MQRILFYRIFSLDGSPNLARFEIVPRANANVEHSKCTVNIQHNISICRREYNSIIQVPESHLMMMFRVVVFFLFFF